MERLSLLVLVGLAAWSVASTVYRLNTHKNDDARRTWGTPHQAVVKATAPTTHLIRTSGPDAGSPTYKTMRVDAIVWEEGPHKGQIAVAVLDSDIKQGQSVRLWRNDQGDLSDSNGYPKGSFDLYFWSGLLGIFTAAIATIALTVIYSLALKPLLRRLAPAFY